MSFTDAVSRVSQIQTQITSLQTAFTPPATSTGTGASTSTSFADALAQAQQTGTPIGLAQDVSATGGASLPSSAQTMLTSGQQQFASRLAAQTGLDPSVISAWLLAEESGGAAQSRQCAEQQRLAQHRLHRQRHLRLGRLGLEQPDHRRRRDRRLAQRPGHDPRLRDGERRHPVDRWDRGSAPRRADRRAPAVGLGIERLSQPGLAVPASRRLAQRELARRRRISARPRVGSPRPFP